MDNNRTAGDLLRLIGFVAIFVGMAWVVQVFGFGTPGLGRLAWELAAAAACGIGVGLLVTSASLVDEEAASAGV